MGARPRAPADSDRVDVVEQQPVDLDGRNLAAGEADHQQPLKDNPAGRQSDPESRPTRTRSSIINVRPDCQYQPSTVNQPMARQRLRHQIRDRRCSVKHARW
jgi:hypothetical protein